MNNLEERTSRAMPLEESLRYATSLAENLRRMHREGKVCGALDAAHIAWDGKDAKLSPNGQPGSAAYVAPEQVRGEAADARSDVFVFGAVLYELLSGRRPFPAENPEQLKRQILEYTPEPLAGIPQGIAALLNSCLEKNRDRRLQRMNSILIELKLAGALGAASQRGLGVEGEDRFTADAGGRA